MPKPIKNAIANGNDRRPLEKLPLVGHRQPLSQTRRKTKNLR